MRKEAREAAGILSGEDSEKTKQQEHVHPPPPLAIIPSRCHVRIAGFRVLSMFSHTCEYFELVPNIQRVLRMKTEDPSNPDHTGAYGVYSVLHRNEFMMIVEVVRGLRTFEGTRGFCTCSKGDQCQILFDLGKLGAFDALINNIDRLPMRCLWNNDGNLANVLLDWLRSVAN